MKRELIVGIVFLAAVCLTAFGTIAISGLDLLAPKAIWRVQLKDLGGLERGDDVRVLGHLMGVVEKIRFNRERYVFRLRLGMQLDAPIHEGYKITVRDTTALGGKHLYIDPGRPGAPEADPKNLVGEPRASDLMGMVSDVLMEVRSVTEKIAKGEGSLGKFVARDELYKNLEDASASLKVVAERIENGQGAVGRLINEDDVYVQLKELSAKLNNGNSALAKLMQDESGAIVDDLRSVSESLKSITAKINEGRGTIGRLVNDAKLYDNADLALANASDIMQDARNGKGTLGKLVTDDALYDNASSFVKHINNASAKIDDGQGTVGKLINDPELYDKVKKLLTRAIDAIENARDSAPVSAITSFIFGPFQ